MKNLSAIILLFLANSVSGIAQGISMIAIPWYFTQQEEMAVYGWIYFFVVVIALVWSPFAGTLVDKYNRKNIFLLLSLICGSIISFVAFYGHQNEGLPLSLIALVFACTFLNYNLHYPNLYAFVQEITEEKHYSKITSIIEIQGQFAMVLAGAGAAFLLEGVQGSVHLFGFNFTIPFSFEPWTLYEIFTLDAATYILAILLILPIRFVSFRPRTKEVGSIRTQFKTGYNYLKDHRGIFIFGVSSYAVFVCVLITTFYISALYVDKQLNSPGYVYASAEGYYAIGALLSGIAIQWVFSKTSPITAVIILTFITAFFFTLMGFTASIMMFYLMNFVLGITNAGIRILRVTYFFQQIPNQFYGRTNSILGLTHIIGRLFFLPIFSIPFFHQSNHVIYTMHIMAIFMVINGIIMIAFYSLFPQKK